MSKRGLSHGSGHIVPPSLAQYEQFCAKGGRFYLDAEDFSEIIHYYLVLKLYDKAEVAIDKALEIHPSNWKILLEKAYCHFDQGDLMNAKKILANISEVDEDVILFRADIFFAEGKIKKALALLSSINIKKDVTLLSNIFYLLLDYNLVEEANEYLTQVEKGLISDVELMRLTADLLIAKSAFKEAVSSFDSLISEDPFNELLYWGQAKCYFELRMFYEAINSCLLGLAINDRLDDLYLIMGQAYYSLFLFDNAITCLQKAGEVSGNASSELLRELIDQICIDKINVEYYRNDYDLDDLFDDHDHDEIKEGGLMSPNELIHAARYLNRAKYYHKDERLTNLNIPHDILGYMKNNSSEIDGEVIRSLDSTQEDIISIEEIALLRDKLHRLFGVVENSRSQYSESDEFDGDGYDFTDSFADDDFDEDEEDEDFDDEDENFDDGGQIFEEVFGEAFGGVGGLDVDDNITDEFGREISGYVLDDRSVCFLNNILNEFNDAKAAGDIERTNKLIFSVGCEGLPAQILEVFVDILIIQRNIDSAYHILDEIQMLYGFHNSHVYKKLLLSLYDDEIDQFKGAYDLDDDSIDFNAELEEELRDMNLNFLADDLGAYLKHH